MSILQRFPQAAKFQHASLKYREQLATMFDGNVATGKHAYIPNSSIPSPVDLDKDADTVPGMNEGFTQPPSKRTTDNSPSDGFNSMGSTYCSRSEPMST